jgi:hypothetical protein
MKVNCPTHGIGRSGALVCQHVAKDKGNDAA